MKKFFILILILFIIFCNTISFGATYTIDETYMYEIYNGRCASFIMRFNETASNDVKNYVASLYTGGQYFPFLAVRNTQGSDENTRWGGLSDYPYTCTKYNHLILYFIPFAYSTTTEFNTGYMSFSDAKIFKYQSSNTGYFADCRTDSFGSNYYTYNNPEIYTAQILYGYHSKYLDDYFWGIKYGNTEQIASILKSANNHLNNIEDSLTSTTPSAESEAITNDLQNTNNNTSADSINTSFFSNITSLFSNIGNYDLSDNLSVTIPLPHSDTGITINGNYLYNSLPTGFKALIYSFWYFIFGFYAFKFINKIYISVKSGNILDGFKSNNEVITNDML